MLNNMMGEDDLHPDGFHASPPGQRVASMMAPSILLRDGGVNLVLGSGGSKRIRTALLQTVSAVVDFGLDVLAAVESPRVHWDGLVLQVEPGYSPREIAQLGSQLDINVWDVRDVYFGGVNAVSPAGAAAADPRRGGSAQLL
jgi:gamma-glutamyltranspeptidase/glutathione hydrolase